MMVETFKHNRKTYTISFDGEKYHTERETPCCGKKVSHSVSSLPNLKQTIKNDKDCIVCSQKPGVKRTNRGSFKKGQKPYNKKKKSIYVVRVYRTFIRLIQMTGTLPAETHLKVIDTSAYHSFKAQFTKKERTEMMLKLKRKFNVEVSYGYRNKDGELFRGFYEFVLSSFLTYHNVNINFHKYILNSGFITDGYFTDFDIWWEHYGDLNKNNDIKNIVYKDNNLSLIVTDDKITRKLSLVDLYSYFLETFKKIIGINHKSLSFNEICQIIEDYSLTNTIKQEKELLVSLVKKYIDENDIGIEQQVRNYGKGHDAWSIISFMNKYFGGSAYNLQKWLNDEHNFNFKLKLPNGYWLIKENCLNKIKEIISDLGYLPPQTWFSENGLSRLYKMINVFWGGISAFRRNTLYEGNMIDFVYNILGEEKTPYDLEYNWNNQRTYIDTINYVNKIGFSITTAQSLNDLKEVTNGLTTSLRASLNPKNKKNYYTKFSEFKKELL